MSTSFAADSVFSRVFDDSQVASIDFNPSWANGTGYFNSATRGKHAPSLTPGQMVKATDNNGRRIILIGTRFGNVVVFDRYAKASGEQVFVTNAPSSVTVKSLIERGAVSEEGMFTLLGCPGTTDNIGETIEAIAAEMEEFTVAA